MSDPHTETPTIGLGLFIKERRFMVPSHQRDYSWPLESVNQFLDDIENAYNTKSTIYFCGLMVFTQTDTPALKVLDGQQRLATTIMIFSAMRNWLCLHPQFKDFEYQTRDNFLGTCDIGETEVKPKLELTSANNELFYKLIIQPSNVDAIEGALEKADMRNGKLLRAAIAINRRISKKADDLVSPDIAEQYFRDFTKYVASEVRIVNFVLKTDGAAYTIFETLNDRGLELFPLDLVKNYLFSQADRFPVGGLRDLEGRWTELMTLLGPRADSFLRAFWASRHGSMEGTRLFTAFKKTYKTPEAAYQISIDMRAAAEHYAALFNSADPIWSRYSDSARQSVDALGILGLTQSYPIILAALERKFSKGEMERLLQLLEVIAVRFQLINSGRPGRVESLGGRAAKEIFERKITKAAQVRAALEELYIPDTDFKNAFRSKSERSSKKARYVLEGIERQSLQRDGVAFPAELIPGDVKLEHIYPKGAADAWAAEVARDPKLKEMLHRLGNMCLLVKDRLGNKGFPVKRAVFAKSRLNTTKKVAERENWGSKEIETRQGQMAELAAARWRFP